MNTMRYVRSLTILLLSGTLMLAFNNCADVAFRPASNGTVFKISDDVIDTNDIDGTEITEDNFQQYEETLDELADEQSSDDSSSSNEYSSNDDMSDDPSSEEVAKEATTKKRSCSKDKNKEGFKKDKTDYDNYKCKEVVGGIEAASARKSVICQITPSGVVHEKCLLQGAVRAHLEVVGRNPGHRVFSGPCSQLAEEED